MFFLSSINRLISVRCSQIPPLRLLFLPSQFVFVQASFSRSAANDSATNEWFRIWLLRFSDVKKQKAITNRKKGLGPSQELSEDTRVPIWSQDGPRLKRGSTKPRNPIPFLQPKSRLGLAVSVHYFLRCSIFNSCCFWVPEASISAPVLALVWELWGIRKTTECVVKIINFRGSTPSRQSLLINGRTSLITSMIRFEWHPRSRQKGQTNVQVYRFVD